MAKIVSWNADQLVAKARQTAVVYASELNDELKKQIEKEQFRWPRKTVRYGSGTVRVVGSPRDIVATGRFLSSQTFETTDDGARISWGAPYARAILRGTEPGHLPRDWITPALDAKPYAPNFLRIWQRFSISSGGQTY